jgi:hypothetical protein
MNRVRTTFALIALVLVSCCAGQALAVCLNPETLSSNYRIPLKQEIDTSLAIVVGKVVGVNRLHDDPAYPGYYSATIFTVQVLRELRGNLPTIVRLKTENDSGRYEMATGEIHLLFLTRFDPYSRDIYRADSCGNSSLLPRGNDLLRKTEELLGETGHAP